MAREGSTRLKSQERGRQLAYHDAVVRLLYTYCRFLVKRTKEAATNVGPIALPTIRYFHRFFSPFLLSSFPLIDQIKNIWSQNQKSDLLDNFSYKNYEISSYKSFSLFHHLPKRYLKLRSESEFLFLIGRINRFDPIRGRFKSHRMRRILIGSRHV